jgi:hypothetical protein
MNVKGFERKRSWLNLRYLEGLSKTAKTLSRYSVSGQRFEPGTSKMRCRNVNQSTTTFSEHRYNFCVTDICTPEIKSVMTALKVDVQSDTFSVVRVCGPVWKLCRVTDYKIVGILLLTNCLDYGPKRSKELRRRKFFAGIMLPIS